MIRWPSLCALSRLHDIIEYIPSIRNNWNWQLKGIVPACRLEMRNGKREAKSSEVY